MKLTQHHHAEHISTSAQIAFESLIQFQDKEYFIINADYFTSINSTSKIRTAFGGITPPAPLSPYPK